VIYDEALDDSQVRKDTVTKHSCGQEDLHWSLAHFQLLAGNKFAEIRV
jgi:hypothetical protein